MIYNPPVGCFTCYIQVVFNLSSPLLLHLTFYHTYVKTNAPLTLRNADISDIRKTAVPQISTVLLQLNNQDVHLVVLVSCVFRSLNVQEPDQHLE